VACDHPAYRQPPGLTRRRFAIPFPTIYLPAPRRPRRRGRAGEIRDIPASHRDQHTPRAATARQNGKTRRSACGSLRSQFSPRLGVQCSWHSCARRPGLSRARHSVRIIEGNASSLRGERGVGTRPEVRWEPVRARVPPRGAGRAFSPAGGRAMRRRGFGPGEVLGRDRRRRSRSARLIHAGCLATIPQGNRRAEPLRGTAALCTTTAYVWIQPSGHNRRGGVYATSTPHDRDTRAALQGKRGAQITRPLPRRRNWICPG
jgi:hypothetical protein